MNRSVSNYDVMKEEKLTYNLKLAQVNCQIVKLESSESLEPQSSLFFNTL